MNSLKKLCNIFFDNSLLESNPVIVNLRNTLQRFCDTGKKEDAFTVYYCYCEIFNFFGEGYDTIGKLIEFLSDYEYHSGELLNKHRDHYSHSVYVFAIGLALYENNKNIRDSFLDFYKTMNFDKNDFVRIWGMTALFHDIGYPFQLAHEQIKTYVEDVLGTDADLNPHVSYENMNHVLYINNELIGEYQDIIRNNLVTEMFAYNISKHLNLNYDIILDDLNNRFRNKKQYMDHGYFSAVLLFDKVLKSKNKIDESSKLAKKFPPQ